MTVKEFALMVVQGQVDDGFVAALGGSSLRQMAHEWLWGRAQLRLLRWWLGISVGFALTLTVLVLSAPHWAVRHEGAILGLFGLGLVAVLGWVGVYKKKKHYPSELWEMEERLAKKLAQLNAVEGALGSHAELILGGWERARKSADDDLRRCASQFVQASERAEESGLWATLDSFARLEIFFKHGCIFDEIGLLGPGECWFERYLARPKSEPFSESAPVESESGSRENQPDPPAAFLRMSQ